MYSCQQLSWHNTEVQHSVDLFTLRKPTLNWFPMMSEVFLEWTDHIHSREFMTFCYQSLFSPVLEYYMFREIKLPTFVNHFQNDPTKSNYFQEDFSVRFHLISVRFLNKEISKNTTQIYFSIQTLNMYHPTTSSYIYNTTPGTLPDRASPCTKFTQLSH